MMIYLAKYPFKFLIFAFKYNITTIIALNILIMVWLKSFFNIIDYIPTEDGKFE